MHLLGGVVAVDLDPVVVVLGVRVDHHDPVVGGVQEKPLQPENLPLQLRNHLLEERRPQHKNLDLLLRVRQNDPKRTRHSITKPNHPAQPTNPNLPRLLHLNPRMPANTNPHTHQNPPHVQVTFHRQHLLEVTHTMLAIIHNMVDMVTWEPVDRG